MVQDSQTPSAEGKHIIETPLLIIGTGPAGAALACFLSHPPYAIKGIMISASATTSLTPRAHITNPAALECLRDIGLDGECLERATKGDSMLHTRWCHSMTGEEYARIYSWGNDPKRRADYDSASPFSHVDLPQTEFEQVIVRRAMADGWSVRFSTTLLSFEEESDGRLLCHVRDDVTKMEYWIRTKYLFGADGARTQVLRGLDIPLIRKPGQGVAWNVLIKADLSDHVEARKGNLHWVMQPDKEYPDFAWAGLVRMVKPWHEWIFILFPLPDAEIREPGIDELRQRCQDLIGRSDIPFEILDVSKWQINEIVAEYYSRGHVFCLGDSVHRHPPFNGLGSNTCVQDAYNLAWKVKYVAQGLALPSILETYSPERQPVGVSVITRANQGIRDHIPIWDLMGCMEKTVEERMAILNSLDKPGAANRERREKLARAIENSSHEFHAIGVEMNVRYESSSVYVQDEIKAGRAAPEWPEDPVLYHRISTYPGHRLPHVWLNTTFPSKENTSTHDLAGHGVFCLITGIGGEGWKLAAENVGKSIGVVVKTYSIGWRQDYEDIYRDWEKRREVEEDGCVLVRPDRFVCWRSKELVDDCSGKLEEVLKSVLQK